MTENVQVHCVRNLRFFKFAHLYFLVGYYPFIYDKQIVCISIVWKATLALI